MPRLSLAMIAKNEEGVLGRCLESVKDCVDEIIVVDTGSTDRTKEVAAKYTDKVFDFKWIDDFSAARNYAFERCTGDFIMWLDCDDVIKPEDAEKLKTMDLSDKEIVISPYEYAHDEFDNSICTVPRERIVKRSLGLKWEQPIHEFLPLLGKLHNAADCFSVHHYRKRGTSERNLRILEKIVAKKPDDSRNIYYLGKEYMDFGRRDEAIEYFTKFVDRGDGFWEDLYQAHYKLGMCYRSMQDEKNFKEHMFKSISIEERRAEPFYQLGNHYETIKVWDKAIQWYEACTRVQRPKNLLATYQPEFYTWLPCLQLCVCYSAIGNMAKAKEYNDRVLEYRPKDTRALANDSFLKGQMVKPKTDGLGKKLNLGCGGKTMPGFVNVDIFPGKGVDEVFSMEEIPYLDNTIETINSEHSLEHLGWKKADQALAEWYRVLKPGGELLLKIPDFADCCRKYLETPDSNKTHKQWYKYTVYGIQQSQAGEPDEAQTHLCGYSKAEMDEKLKGLGFVIDYSINYDGWDTPSTALRAVKTVSNLKIGWISPMSWEGAQTRIRVLNVDRWLRSRGYNSSIVNYPEIINQNYDVAIVGKSFDENHYKNVRMLKQKGKTVYADLCEDILYAPWVKEILAMCDKVICCSPKLEEVVKSVNINTMVIEDAWEAL